MYRFFNISEKAVFDGCVLCYFNKILININVNHK